MYLKTYDGPGMVRLLQASQLWNPRWQHRHMASVQLPVDGVGVAVDVGGDSEGGDCFGWW